MSSARISAHKGGVEVLPKAAATPRAGDAADPATGFAAALGAMAANFHPPSGHHSHGSGDAPAGEDPTADGGDVATGDKSAISAAPAGDTGNPASITTLPGLSGWFAAGNQASAGTAVGTAPGQGPSAKPGAAASEAAAAAVAVSLVGAATQPIAAAAVVVGTGAADTPVQQAGPAATGLTKPPADHPGGPLVGAGATADTDTAKAVHASHADPQAPGIPADAARPTSGPAAADPTSPVFAADLSAAPLTQALPSPVPARTGQFDAAALAAALPAALVNPVAPSAGGAGTRDFADTARDGQAAAAAAFSGVAAADSGTGSAGGLGAPSVDAAASSAPSLGADAGASNVATQLSGQVLRLLANSGHEAVVRLYPPDLGEVTLRVAVSGRDVSAWFGSSQPAVQETISHGLGQLQADLGNAGYNLSNAWVGADASGSGSRGDSAPSLPAAPARTTSVAPAAPVAAALSSNSGVSIYV